MDCIMEQIKFEKKRATSTIHLVLLCPSMVRSFVRNRDSMGLVRIVLKALKKLLISMDTCLCTHRFFPKTFNLAMKDFQKKCQHIKRPALHPVNFPVQNSIYLTEMKH